MKFHLYRENFDMQLKDWRWKLHANDGRVVALSAESYKNFGDMMRTLRSIFQSSPLRSAELLLAEEAARKLHGMRPPR